MRDTVRHNATSSTPDVRVDDHAASGHIRVVPDVQFIRLGSPPPQPEEQSSGMTESVIPIPVGAWWIRLRALWWIADGTALASCAEIPCWRDTGDVVRLPPSNGYVFGDSLQFTSSVDSITVRCPDAVSGRVLYTIR